MSENTGEALRASGSSGTDESTCSIQYARTKRKFAIALALSGCAALSYQVAWQRVLTQIIGSDAVSMVLVVTIFMLCLGVGSELARFLVARSQAQALWLYAIIEVAVGVYGMFSIPLLRAANASSTGFTNGSLTLDFLLNLLLLSLPIIGMGLTTPLIVHVAKQNLQNVGRTVGALYGWNIAGAAIGAILTGLIFIEALGLSGTTQIAAALNLLAALIALSAFGTLKLSRPEVVRTVKQRPTPFPIGAAIAAVLFGFGTLSIQIVFFRILSNYFTLSTIVFPVVLCSYLVLMSLGQWLGGRLADKYHANLLAVTCGLFASGAILFLFALRFPPSWAASLGALRFTNFNGSLIEKTHPNLIGDPSVLIVMAFSAVFMLSVVAWSSLFPVMFRFVTERVSEAGTKFARVYTLYTIGNVAGAFICGIFFLPVLGTGGAASATILIVGAGCFFLLSGASSRSLAPWGLALIGVASTPLIPHDYYKTFRLGDYIIADVFEGRTGVATVVHTQRFFSIIDINRTASASALSADPEPKDQYEAWRWNHTELMALDPTFRPKRVLVIGIGHAYLVDALLDIPTIEKIVVVDISQEIVSAVKAYTKTSTQRIFNDPRVEIVIADGRRYVQSAVKRGEHFDLIQTKINEPWHAGGGNLFTVEFFETQKKLLSPGGYLGVRPLLGHLTDGLKVYKTAIWPGYAHLFFKNGDLASPSEAVVTKDIHDSWHIDLPGRPPTNHEKRNHLNVAFFSSVPNELLVDHNTDDRPTFEYYWVRKATGNWMSPQTVFWNMDMKKYQQQIPVRYE